MVNKVSNSWMYLIMGVLIIVLFLVLFVKPAVLMGPEDEEPCFGDVCDDRHLAQLIEQRDAADEAVTDFQNVLDPLSDQVSDAKDAIYVDNPDDEQLAALTNSKEQADAAVVDAARGLADAELILPPYDPESEEYQQLVNTANQAGQNANDAQQTLDDYLSGLSDTYRDLLEDYDAAKKEKNDLQDTVNQLNQEINDIQAQCPN
ncbi:MAG: hypothetical protein Q7R87_04955 [Nanoarchaeota archaeon]|nr:hypothetical protein [Nanoarchaeota archaeon]